MAESVADAVTLAVEGPAWLLADFAAHRDTPSRREKMLEILAMIEAEPSILGASAHILAVGRKQRLRVGRS